MMKRSSNTRFFRIWALSMALIMTVIAACPLAWMVPVFAAEGETTAGSGDAADEGNDEESKETEEITVASVEDFRNFASNCYIDSWSTNKIVNLVCDLDFTGQEITVVPVFNGTFNGNGYTISGFDYEGSGFVTALFRYVEPDGVINGLNVQGNLSSADEKECIGGIAGINYGTISGCSFWGTVSGMTTIGGIAAVNKGSGVITKCSSGGKISAYYFTGGIAGKNHGIITNCQNAARVNADSEWVAEDDEMSSSIIDSLNTDSVSIHSGVDTGGIAGFSDGIIASCTNMGRIGYEHTGYNIGGIVGRQSGIVSLCVNKGTVFGRKDIGGIAGQMEPYIREIEAETLRSAIDEFHDLLEKTLDDMGEGGNVLHGDLEKLRGHADRVVDTSDIMADEIADFVNGNMEQLDLLTARMEYVSDCLPPILDNITLAGDGFMRLNNDLKKLNEDLDVKNRLEGNSGAYEQYQNAVKQVEDAVDRFGASAGEGGCAGRIEEIIKDENGDYKKWVDLSESERKEIIDGIIDVLEDSEEMSEAAGDILDGLSSMYDVLSPYMDAAQNDAHEDIKKATEDMQDCINHINAAVDGLKGIVNYLNAQSDIRFTRLSGDFEVQRDNLYNEFKDISNCLEALGDNALEYSDLVNDDLKAVNDKLNEIFNLLLDKIEAYSEFNTDGVYDDVSDEEMEATTTGRVDICTNKGSVEGDINVGGITGSMAIDDDDLESNAAGKAGISIGNRYLTKCIINNSRNEGYVIAKKDGAGGVAGYMKMGIIMDSKSYGSVESTEGGYAGGICGDSSGIIRGSYALCSVYGGKYVGGIAGYGDRITDCYAMVYLEAKVGRAGAIAGQIASFESEEEENDDKVRGNFYVNNGVHGIDGISYVGVAEPIEYSELLKVRNLPIDFWHLKASFRVGNTNLGTQELDYGESLENLIMPEIPEREGCYGVWPDLSGRIMIGNIVISGEYVENITVVEGSQKTEEEEGKVQKAYALVSEQFTEDTVLYASISSQAPPQEITGKSVVYDIRIENSSLNPASTSTLRLLNPYENATVYRLADGVWTKMDSKVRGSYLQVEMSGTDGTFCVAQNTPDIVRIVCIVIAAIAAAGVAALVTTLGKHKKH